MKRLLAAGAFAVILALSGYVLYLRGMISARDRTIAAAVSEVAIANGAIRVERATSAQIVNRLSDENAELLKQLKKVDTRVRPVAHVESVASIEDTVVLGPDEHRFRLVRVEGDLFAITRKQQFRLDVVILRNVDGSRLGKLTFQELDPVTGAALDVTPQLESRFQFVEEPVERGVFHPRVVVGVESHGYPIAGLQVLNGERFGGLLAHTNLSIFGGYNISDKTPLGGAVIGYRPFNWNLSVGPAVFFGSGGVAYGGAVTLEVTR